MTTIANTKHQCAQCGAVKSRQFYGIRKGPIICASCYAKARDLKARAKRKIKSYDICGER